MTHFFRRFRQRRNDKLKLFVLLVIGVFAPVFACWIMPNIFAAERERQSNVSATATADAFSAFITAHPEVEHLCDNAPEVEAEIEPAGLLPSEINLVVIQYSRFSAFQSALPPTLQYDTSKPISVVVCLSREVARPTRVCLNGQPPDLSQQGQVSVTHYLTAATAYNVQTGEMIAHTDLVGPDPGVCSDPSGSTNGERLTSDTLQTWLNDVLVLK